MITLFFLARHGVISKTISQPTGRFALFEQEIGIVAERGSY